MKPVYIIQHESFVQPGSITDYLINNRIKFKIVEIFNKPTFPELDKFEHLIILGGSMNLDQENEFPWLIEENLFIEEVIERKKKILAICLGAQLVAKVLNANVYKNEYDEIGWFPLQRTPEGQKSDLLKTIKADDLLFQSHSYVFDLPSEAKRLASTEASPNQVFNFADHVFGLQFHPEVTFESLKILFNQQKEPILDGRFVQKFVEIINKKNLFERSKQIMFNILDAFFQL